jgi:hypothetical protein
VNDDPVARADSFNAVQGTPLSISFASLLANDSDVDLGDTLSITGFSNVTGGSVSQNANGFLFTPSRSGQGGFQYSLIDGQGGSREGSISLQIATPPPSASYSFTPSVLSLREGERLSFQVSSQNAATGTAIYWRFSGSGIALSDFRESTLSGNGTIGADGKFSFSTQVLDDGVREGTETLEVTFYSDSIFSNPLGPSTLVSIQDMVTGGPTDQADVVTGTDAADVIRGVPEGSSLRGRGTNDVLSGNGGPDLFLLGDATGKYYDDGDKATAGSKDFAYITDFTAADRIQLHGRPEDYVLGPGRLDINSPRATLIYAKNPDRPSTTSPHRPWSRDEWIGMVVTSDPAAVLSLTNSNQFTYQNLI